MMETKLWAALCALLLMNLASAENDESHAVPSPASESVPGIPAAESVPTSSLDPISLAATTPSPNGTDTSSSVTSSLSSNTATEGKPISLTPEPKKDNGTGNISPSVAAGPEQNGTDPTTSQPPSPPSGTDGPTSHIPLTSTTISPTHTTHQAASAHTDSITNQPTNPETHTPTSVATPEPAKHEITTTPTITTTQSSSTSSTSSSQESPNSESSTLAPPQNTSGPDGHLETSSVAHQKTAIIPPSSPSAHADTPSQLNVGGDTTMVHESPTLDPLLAGLVSAFIITAVIITLLLFLKLRRRDNRPEFRRLQDLPMDDMMEDTPLSMYSY